MNIIHPWSDAAAWRARQGWAQPFSSDQSFEADGGSSPYSVRQNSGIKTCFSCPLAICEFPSVSSISQMATAADSEQRPALIRGSMLFDVPPRRDVRSFIFFFLPQKRIQLKVNKHIWRVVVCSVTEKDELAGCTDGFPFAWNFDCVKPNQNKREMQQTSNSPAN